MFFIQSGEPAAVKRFRLDLFDDLGYVVGYVKMEQPLPGTMYVYALKVFKEFRGLGYARMLLEEIIKRCKGFPGTRRITINACPFEDAACPLEGLVRLYESYGFRVSGSTATTKHMRMDL